MRGKPLEHDRKTWAIPFSKTHYSTKINWYSVIQRSTDALRHKSWLVFCNTAIHFTKYVGCSWVGPGQAKLRLVQTQPIYYLGLIFRHISSPYTCKLDSGFNPFSKYLYAFVLIMWTLDYLDIWKTPPNLTQKIIVWTFA